MSSLSAHAKPALIDLEARWGDKGQAMEIFDVSAAPVSISEWKWSQSDWIVQIDGETRSAYRVNSKTGEREEVNYEQAISSLRD